MIIRVLKKFSRILRMKRNPVGYARSIGVSIGSDCLIINLTEGTFGSEPYLITLGNHVAIASGACFMTHDGGAWVMRLEESNMDLIAPIVVGNNVLIGVNAIIMPGVKIGNDCIVAASSVVSRDVPDGTIVGGIPAKPIKTVAEYREGALKRALYIKGLSPEDKRSYLIGHFDSKGR